MNEPYVISGGIQWTDVNGTLVGTINNITTSYANKIIGDTDLILMPIAGTDPETRMIEATGHVPFLSSQTVDRTVRLQLVKYFKSVFHFSFFDNSLRLNFLYCLLRLLNSLNFLFYPFRTLSSFFSQVINSSSNTIYNISKGQYKN